MNGNSKIPGVLFVCSKNGGKFQLAAGLMRELAGESVTVYYSGTKPWTGLDPESVESTTDQRAMMTSSLRGPWTPSTRSSSMSLVALGPLIMVSGLVPSIRRSASGRIPAMSAAFTTQM
ncbi:hypothetical protein ABIB45_002482 [Arthrobacter sp. UYCo732]